MTGEPGIIDSSLIEFGQTGEYHTAAMSAEKQSAGFAPLETLPAEWYNNYMALLDTHINQLQVLMLQIQEELKGVIEWDDKVTPSATDLSQVLGGITRKIDAMLPVIATGSTPGLVVSSAGAENVSVDANGVMKYNGHEVLEQEIEDNKTALEQQVEDAVDDLKETINTRGHLITLLTSSYAQSGTTLSFTMESRLDDGDLSKWEPQVGDMLCVVWTGTDAALQTLQSLQNINMFAFDTSSITTTVPQLSYSTNSNDYSLQLGKTSLWVITSVNTTTQRMLLEPVSGISGLPAIYKGAGDSFNFSASTRSTPVYTFDWSSTDMTTFKYTGLRIPRGTNHFNVQHGDILTMDFTTHCYCGASAEEALNNQGLFEVHCEIAFYVINNIIVPVIVESKGQLSISTAALYNAEVQYRIETFIDSSYIAVEFSIWDTTDYSNQKIYGYLTDLTNTVGNFSLRRLHGKEISGMLGANTYGSDVPTSATPYASENLALQPGVASMAYTSKYLSNSCLYNTDPRTTSDILGNLSAHTLELT